MGGGGEEEKIGVLVKRKDVKRAIERLMDGGEEGDEMRERAIELSRLANGAMEPEGSSYVNMEMLIQDIMQQTFVRESAQCDAVNQQKFAGPHDCSLQINSNFQSSFHLLGIAMASD